MFRGAVPLVALVAVISLGACSSSTQLPEHPVEEQTTEQGSPVGVTTEEDAQDQREPEPIADDEVYSCFDGLLSGGVIVEDQPLGSILVRFVPDMELSHGPTRGHIEPAAQ